jgi:predicted nucleic acid-binding Zn ribbon protein
MPINPDELRRECIQCGRVYFARRTDARYCSNLCRQRAYDQRQREKRTA